MKHSPEINVDEISNLRCEVVRFSRDMHKLPLSQWKRPPSVETMARYNALRVAVARVAPGADDGWHHGLGAGDEDSMEHFACFDIVAYVDLVLSRLPADLPPER